MKSSSAAGAGGAVLSAPAQVKLDEAMGKCKSLLQQLNANKDAEPFATPVRWEEWGLRDYPKVIKYPMDLGTVGVS